MRGIKTSCPLPGSRQYVEDRGLNRAVLRTADQRTVTNTTAKDLSPMRQNTNGPVSEEVLFLVNYLPRLCGLVAERGHLSLGIGDY